MIRRAWLVRLAATMLGVLVAAPGWAEARVRVHQEGRVVQVLAEIDTRADRETAWQVLTDYGNWSNFIPDLLVCRVISKTGDPVRLEQRGRIPWLPNFPLVMIVEVEELPMKLIRFRRVAGNVRGLVAEWRVQGNDPARLIYRAAIEPGLPVPPQVSIEVFRHDAKVRLEALAEEIARRAERRGP